MRASLGVLIEGETGEVSAPEFIAPRASLLETAPRPTGDTFPEFLSDGWDDNTPPVKPTLVAVEGGLPLLYAGESHLLYGESGKGKSFLAYFAAAQVAAAGGIVVLIDRESNRRTVRDRLKALGVNRAQAGRIAYWKPSGSLMPDQPARSQLDTWLARYDVELVILDSVSKDLAAAGLGENDPGEYVRWQQHVVEPWTTRRITSLLIDHVGHQGSQRLAAPRGASSKKDQVSGMALFFRSVKQFTRDSSGRAELVCAKDREGYREDGKVVAVMHVEVADGGESVTIRLTAPDGQESEAARAPQVDSDAEYRKLVTDLLLEHHHDPLTGNQLATRVKGLPGRSAIPAARVLKSLVAEGLVSASAPGLRGAIHYRLAERHPDVPLASSPQ